MTSRKRKAEKRSTEDGEAIEEGGETIGEEGGVVMRILACVRSLNVSVHANPRTISVSMTA